MNLFEVLPIDRELECRGECRERGADERMSIRSDYLKQQMRGYDRFYLLPFETERLGEIGTKYAIWFLTCHGPFRTTRGNASSPRVCRFCKSGLELPEHLLFDCKQLIDFKLTRGAFTIPEFENSARRITYKLCNKL